MTDLAWLLVLPWPMVLTGLWSPRATETQPPGRRGNGEGQGTQEGAGRHPRGPEQRPPRALRQCPLIPPSQATPAEGPGPGPPRAHCALCSEVPPPSIPISPPSSPQAALPAWRPAPHLPAGWPVSLFSRPPKVASVPASSIFSLGCWGPHQAGPVATCPAQHLSADIQCPSACQEQGRHGGRGE